jgi:hypothetical protein
MGCGTQLLNSDLSVPLGMVSPELKETIIQEGEN